MNKPKKEVGEVVDIPMYTLNQWLRTADDQPRVDIQSAVLFAGVIGPLESHTVDLALISTPGYI